MNPNAINDGRIADHLDGIDLEKIMKAFVWGDTSFGEAGNGKDFLRDYFNGMAVVIAETEGEAMIELSRAYRAAGYGSTIDDAAEEPAVYEIDGPLTFAVYGKS